MARLEFTRKTKLAAWTKADGRCQECGKKIRPGDGPEYHHIREAFYAGDNGIDNCQVLCIPCHGEKTKDIAPAMAKSRRIIKTNANVRKRPGFRSWRKFNGDLVYTDRS